MTVDFPNDENGNVLRSHHQRGDTLTEPHEINFIFPIRG